MKQQLLETKGEIARVAGRGHCSLTDKAVHEGQTMYNHMEVAGFNNPQGNIATGEQMWYTFFENLLKK